MPARPNQKVHFMSERQDWGTPPAFLEYLVDFFSWSPDLDAAASPENAKAPFFFTKEDDALTQDWFGRVWLNPPFGRVIGDFIDKCIMEIKNPKVDSIFALVPARTDTAWAHRAFGSASHIYLIKGRFNFRFDEAIPGANAPFPSMLLFWHTCGCEGCEQIEPLDVPKEYRGFLA